MDRRRHSDKSRLTQLIPRPAGTAIHLRRAETKRKVAGSGQAHQEWRRRQNDKTTAMAEAATWLIDTWSPSALLAHEGEKEGGGKQNNTKQEKLTTKRDESNEQQR